MNESLTQFGEVGAHWLLAWSAVALAVALGVQVARPRRASVRYAGWLVAMFAGLLLAPMMAGVRPRIAWRDFVGREEMPAAAANTERDERFTSWFKYDRNAAVERQQPQPAIEPVVVDGVASQSTTAGRPSEIEGGAFSAAHVAFGLAGVWFVGAVIGCWRLLRSVRFSQRLLGESVPATDAELVEQFNAAVGKLALRRHVRLVVHPQIATPVCVGGLRATVVWPAPENEQLTGRQRAAAVAHELAHVRRYDDWVNLGAELWRVVAWFYLPVHWLVGQLRREQEFMCDDVAAAVFDRPQSYAAMLLGLTRVNVPVGGLCTAFVGPGIKGRIRRLLDARFRKLRPLGRSQAVALAIACVLMIAAAGSVRLVGLAAQAPAAERAEAELPAMTPKEIGEKMAESMKTYARGYFEGEYQEDRNANSSLDGGNGQPLPIRIPGRFRYASDGHRWRGEFEGMYHNQNQTELMPRSWSAGFDGSVHYYSEPLRSRFVFGEQIDLEGIVLPAFFWSFDEDVPKLLGSSWQLQRQEVVGGYRCYSLVLEYVQAGTKRRTELIVSPRQGYLPVRYKMFDDGKIISSHELFDITQAEGGRWYPRRVKRTEAYASRRFDARVTRFEPNREFGDAYFRPEVPPGIGVIDYRTGDAYRNDPWWPEIQPMLRERFNWPAPNTRLSVTFASSAEAWINKQPAPPLSVSEWIQGEPVDLAQLRGKVVLLYFTDPDLKAPRPRETAILKDVYALFHPLGVEFIEIDTHVDDTSAAKHQARELEIPWPIAVDAGSEISSRGKTRLDYRLTTTAPSPMLIDHEGKVRFVPEQRLGETIAELLRGAGVDFTYVPPTESVRTSVDVPAAVNSYWQELVNVAPKDGKIVGKVADNEGALSQVIVEGKMLYEHNSAPGQNSPMMTIGNTTMITSDQRFHAVTGDDGSFELSNLPKGAYVLTLRFPGRAIAEQRVYLKEPTSAARVDVNLSQADGIRGVVLDEVGQPVAGATVQIDSRYRDAGAARTFYNVPQFAPVITDDKGQFSLEGLLTGSYSLQATHDKLGVGTKDRVPAGTKDVVLDLDPKVPMPAERGRRGPGRGGSGRRQGRGAGNGRSG